MSKWFICLMSPALLAGCAASYEPPRAGTHRGPGEAAADIQCSYETPTATRFSQMRCLRAEDMKTQAETARRETDSIKTAPPPPGSLR